MHLNIPNRWHEVAYWALLLVACVVFYWMNLLTTFKDDDMLHSLVIGELTHVNTLGDLLRSYHNKYLLLNGRSSDMVAEFFCAFLGKPFFNVCNTLVFGFMVHVISLLATGRRSLLSQALTYACICTCYPVPGQTMLWLAGSLNYLWTITGSLWLVYYLLHHRGSLGWVKGTLLFVGAFLAGAGNEATSFAFVAAMFLFYLFNRDRIDRPVVLVFIGYALGVGMIMGSPAAWRRVAADIVTDNTLMGLMSYRIHVLGDHMYRYVTISIVVVLLLFMLFYKGTKRVAANMWFYLLVCSLLVMIVLGLDEQRPYAPLVTVSLIVTINAVHALLKRFDMVRLLTVVGCLALSSWLCMKAFHVLHDYKAYADQVRSEIMASPRQAVLHPRRFETDNRFVYALKFSSDDFFNNQFIWRYYYDRENVQFVPDSVYYRFHEGRLLDGGIKMPFKDDHGGLVEEVLAFPDQDYMTAKLNLDTVPCVYQVGHSFYKATEALTEQQRVSLIEVSDNVYCSIFCYYPLRYKDDVLFVLPVPHDNDTCLLVVLNQAGSDELRLFRTAPNPREVKVKQE